MIGRPSTDRPISTSTSVGKANASIGATVGGGGGAGTVVVVVLGVVVVVVVVLVVLDVVVVVVDVVVLVGGAVVVVVVVEVVGNVDVGGGALEGAVVTAPVAAGEPADSAGVEVLHPASASTTIAAATQRISRPDERVRPATRRRPA